MADLDKMARELLAEEFVKEGYSSGTAEDMALDGVRIPAIRAIRAALLAAPPGYVLVPVEPTQEMAEAYDTAAMEVVGEPPLFRADCYRAMLTAAKDG